MTRFILTLWRPQYMLTFVSFLSLSVLHFIPFSYSRPMSYYIPILFSRMTFLSSFFSSLSVPILSQPSIWCDSHKFPNALFSSTVPLYLYLLSIFLSIYLSLSHYNTSIYLYLCLLIPPPNIIRTSFVYQFELIHIVLSHLTLAYFSLLNHLPFQSNSCDFLRFVKSWFTWVPFLFHLIIWSHTP